MSSSMRLSRSMFNVGWRRGGVGAGVIRHQFTAPIVACNKLNFQLPIANVRSYSAAAETQGLYILHYWVLGKTYILPCKEEPLL